MLFTRLFIKVPCVFSTNSFIFSPLYSRRAFGLLGPLPRFARSLPLRGVVRSLRSLTSSMRGHALAPCPGPLQSLRSFRFSPNSWPGLRRCAILYIGSKVNIVGRPNSGVVRARYGSLAPRLTRSLTPFVRSSRPRPALLLFVAVLHHKQGPAPLRAPPRLFGESSFGSALRYATSSSVPHSMRVRLSCNKQNQ